VPTPIVVDTILEDPHSGLTLRNAITTANADAAAGNSDTITFDPSLNGQTIVLVQGVLNLGSQSASTGTITIDGGKTISISGNLMSPVFQVQDVNAVLSGLTIKNGYRNVDLAGIPEGGAGIYNGGTLTVNDCSIVGNTAISQSGVLGGGVLNGGTLTLNDSIVSGNTAISTLDMSANAAYGGGIANARTLSVNRCTISGNSARAEYNASGGGVINFGGNAAMTLSASTISGNTSFGGAASSGAGVSNQGDSTISNSTIFGNTCSLGKFGSVGGGVYSGGGYLSVSDSTVSSNRAGIGGGISAPSPTLNGTIVAGNIANTQYPDLDSSYVFGSYNLIGDGSAILIFYGFANEVGTAANPIDPKLGPLQNNGGPTQTMALLPGSLAIGAGGPVTQLSASVGTSDTIIPVDNGWTIASTADQYYILIDGEEMRVTNESSNFIWVTRAINGVSASHARGAQVFLFADQRNLFRQFWDIGAYVHWLNVVPQPFDDPANSFHLPLGEATVFPGSGVLSVNQPLSFDLASGSGGVLPALVYNSGTVNVRPVIEFQVAVATGVVPTQILVDLIWNGTDVGTTTFVPAGGTTAGNTYLLDVRPPAMAQSKVYEWQASVAVQYSTSTVSGTITGSTIVVTRANSPYGAGWGIAGIDQLLPTRNGVLWLYGTGQSRLFTPSGPSTFANPEDFGTLRAISSTVFDYTLAGTTYTFSKNTTTGFFDMTSIADRHTLATIYAYDSANDALTQVVNYDGSTTNVSYTSGVIFNEPGGRNVTLSLDASTRRLTKITDAAGYTRSMSYDADGHLTTDMWDPYQSSFGYSASSGQLSSVTLGTSETWNLTPATGQGFGSNPTATFTPTRATLADTLANTTTYGVDQRGRLIYKNDPLGFPQTWKLDTSGQVTQHVDPNGNSWFLGYDANGNLIKIKTPSGGDETLAYNDFDEETDETILVSGSTTDRATKSYNSTGDVISSTDLADNTTSYTWNNGLLSTMTSPRGGTTTYSYNPSRQLTQSINPNTAATSYLYDAAGYLTAVADPFLQKTSYTYYDKDGHLTQTVDRNQNTTQIKYDAAGFVTATISPKGGIAGATGGTAMTSYDTAGNVTSSSDRVGNSTTIQYDAAARPTLSISPIGGTTSTSFDPDGRATLIINPMMPIGGTTRIQYDKNGNVTKSINPLGGTTTNSYDMDNRLIQTINPAGGNPTGGTATTSYDKEGRVTQSVDYVGNVTLTGYDGDGKVTSTTNPAGGVTSYTYNGDGYVSTMISPISGTTRYDYDLNDNLKTIVNPLGGITSNLYDLANRATKTINPLVGTTTNGYDPNGNVTLRTDPNTIVTSYSYDPDGNLIKTIIPNGTTFTTYLTNYDYNDRPTFISDPVTGPSTIGFDGDGNVTQTISVRNGTVTNFYDKADHVTMSIDGNLPPNRGTTSSSYDLAGNLTMLIDPRLNTTNYQYDNAGRQTLMIDPLGINPAQPGHSVTSRYDANGRVTNIVDQNGRTTVMTYDGLGNVQTEIRYNASGSQADSLSFGYDQSGNVTYAWNQTGGAYTIRYNTNGEATSVTEPFSGVSLSFGYDVAGNRTLVSDSFGGTQSSIYDLDSRLRTLTYAGQSQSVSEILTYRNGGQVNTATMYSGSNLIATTTNGVDDKGNITSILEQFANGSTMGRFDYGYDTGGRVTSQALNGAAPTTFGYDNAGQLNLEGGLAYTYDANGNPTRMGSTLADKGNRLTQFVDPGGQTWNYQYDNVGNRTLATDMNAPITWNYAYDNTNHMLSATMTSGGVSAVIGYIYDAFGNLISKTVQTQTSTTSTEYAVDGWNPANRGGMGLSNYIVWAVLDIDISLQSRQLFSVGLGVGPEATPFARIDQGSAPDGAGVYYTLVDLHGSVSYVLNSTPNAAPLNVITYTAFGIMTQSAPMSFTLGLFAYDGYRYDSDTYLFMVGARVYDAASQRWMQQDPIGFSSGDANPYRYVANSPTTASDPSGLSPWDYLWAGGRTVLTFANPFALAVRAISDSQGLVDDFNLLTGGSANNVILNGGDAVLGNRRTGWFAETGNGASGVARVVTMGVSDRLQDALGLSDQVNRNSDFFRYGTYAGQAINVGLAFANPCALASAVQVAYRGIQAVQAIGGTINAYGNFSNGNYGAGALDLLGVAGNALQLSRVCFTGDTPIITRRGSVRFDELTDQDDVLSAPEDNPKALPDWRRVEELFRNVLPIWHVHVKGQVIRSTAEHPFYVWGKGWTAAWQLEVGDLLRSDDGRMVAVEDICHAGYMEAVYNCRVAEYHTYFVGGEDWGFSVWAHNACDIDKLSRAAASPDRGGLTMAGRSLAKHSVRPGSSIPPVKGSPASINAQAQAIVDDILTSPAMRESTRVHPRFGNILEVMDHSTGRGIRYSAGGDFIHFLGF
jgi:RHS repeat-associated protein